MKLTILGSGTSHGVPVLGCRCTVCRSEDPKDKRMRSSLYVAGAAGESVVIDTGPEFRLQALRAGIRRLDAVLLTHAHADHIHGLDDVRPLSAQTPLPVYCNRDTHAELRERFSYIFKPTQRGGGKPRIIPTVVSAPLVIGGLRFTPVPVKHGALDILGWHIAEGGSSAVYLTDTSAIPAASLPLIGRPETLIIGALRARPHETHFTFEQALNAAIGVQAGRVFVTHLCHDYTHRQIAEYCQAFIERRALQNVSMEPAWDGLTLCN